MSAPKVRKSRHKTPPGLSVAGPSNDGKGTASHQGRKLDFPAKQPLQGKKFYLDLTGPRNKLQSRKIKADLEQLGATVEPFLSKELACVISDRIEVRDGEKGTKGMPSGTSPAVSTPSPFHQGRGISPGAADSPNNPAPESRVVTRGKAIVQKATKSQMYGTTDVLTNARNWNVPIKHLDVVLKYLSRESDKLKLSGKDKKKNGKEKPVTKAKERQLTKPYLKAEDKARRFRPISKEFSTWPRILLDTRKGSCPYDPKTRNESTPQGAERTQDRPDASQRTPDVRHKEMSRSQSLSKKAISKAAKQREATANKNKTANKKGFCEFCSVKYSNLEKHLQTEQHQQHVGEKDNYQHLDSMIAEGPNLVRFLEDCVRFGSVQPVPSSLPAEEGEPSDHEDEVLLISELGTPVKDKKQTQQKKSGNQGDTFSRRKRRSLGRSPEKQSNTEEKSVSKETVPNDNRNRRRRSKSPGRLPIFEGGDTANVASVACNGEARVPGIDSRLGDGDGAVNNGEEQMLGGASPDMAAISKQGSPGISESRRAKSRKRRSGGRRSLSLTLRDSRTVSSTPQGDHHSGGVVLVGREAEGCVLRGIAGEEEPILQEHCADEVVITRVRREEVTGGECDIEVNRTCDRVAPPVEQAMSGGSACPEKEPSPSANAEKEVDCAEGGESHRHCAELQKKSTVDSSQVVSSPDGEKQLSSRRRKQADREGPESDDVFTNNQAPINADIETSLKPNPGARRGKALDRAKRKSRRSHTDAPPRKVRGSSVAIDGKILGQDEMGVVSPCVREPQPRIPATPDNIPSSDDFQPMRTPLSRTKSSGRKSDKKSDGGDAKTDSALESPVLGAKRRMSSRNKASTSQSSAVVDDNSELDFQLAHPRSRKKVLENNSVSGNHAKSDGAMSQCQDQQCAGGVKEATAVVTLTNEGIAERTEERHSEHSADQRMEIDENCPNGEIVPATAEADVRDPVESQPSQLEQSLELVFKSDLAMEESSFLGFSQEEINETANRTEQSKNLEKAALSVYCIPSSDPCPDDNDERSSTGSLGDFTIGLVLQKVDNFPSEGSEWEEQVTGFMKKLDTQLEIKRRRESEISTLPSPNFHKTVFDLQKENHDILDQIVEDLGPEPLSDDADSVFNDVGSNENVQVNNEVDSSCKRRRSARINPPNSRSATRSTPAYSNVSFSGMCVSPSKKRRTLSTSKTDNASRARQPENANPPKQALRELSPNQLMNSPPKGGDRVLYSTPKRTRRNLMGSRGSPGVQHIVLPPGTPAEEQEEIANNYVHDDSESEIVFPKFSSPARKGCIFSPVKHRVKNRQIRQRHRSVPCLGQRDVQSSPIRPSHRSDLLPFGLPSTTRKSLFMKGRVKHISFSSPRKRSKSLLRSPSKNSQFLTFLNELKAGLSTTFYTFKKPHFSLRILQPSALRRHHYKSNMSRSLLALNLCLPSDAELRIYEFHDDDSLDDDDLVISPITSDTSRKEVIDRCTQTPPSSHKHKKAKPRRLAIGKKRSAQSAAANTNGKSKEGKCAEVEHGSNRKGKRSVKVQASSPDADAFFDMSFDYYL